MARGCSRLLEELARGKLASAILVLAMALYGALTLYLTRGTSFTADETQLVADYRGLGVGSLLAPQNSHLIVTLRLLYAADIDLFGSSYLLIRVAEIGAVIATAALVFTLSGRRVGPLAALVPSVVLLFLGSSKIVISPLGIAPIYAISAGLGALLALERRDLRGDLIACALLLISVATYSVGIAFLIGAIVWILLDDDRLRRTWVVAVPLALYAAWFLWARKFGQGEVELSSLLLIPNFALEALAAAAGALGGVNYPFGNETVGPEEVALGWGRILAAVTIAFIALSLHRRPPSKAFWALSAALLTLWALLALSPGPLRTPAEARYVFPGAVLVVLIVAEAARGARVSGRTATALLVAATLALGANLAQFRVAAAELRDVAARTRVAVTMYELAGDNGDPNYSRSYEVPVTLGAYREGIARNGSYGLPLEDVSSQSESLRELADETLAEALGLSILPMPIDAGSSCERVGSAQETVKTIELPPEGGVLRSALPATVSIGRFADAATTGVGEIGGGRFGGLIQIPADDEPTPWFASVSTPGLLELCPLPGARPASTDDSLAP